MDSPESIVVSLDWAKKLKSAGWHQSESVMVWCVCKPEPDCFVWQRSGTTHETDFAAPGAEEILRRLHGTTIKKYEGAEKWHIVFGFGANGKYAIYLQEMYDERTDAMFSEDTLANAAAAMYCYLAGQQFLPSR